eukprot:TRINITY_DN42698_c0_g1_i1.p1 TRINITY_DN42698_c0_g1~~TRINITY_DN42698_c0_g1_i1.p1  ORF type:complete len:100 (+),score=29.31 TRINITY_DN42698_c0_g1_i1:43-300(+)
MVSVVTCDGRHLVGEMKGFDQTINVILSKCHERVYSTDVGVEIVPLGVYIIRGDNIAIVGEVDQEKDAGLNLEEMKAMPLAPIIH